MKGKAIAYNDYSMYKESMKRSESHEKTYQSSEAQPIKFNG